MNRLHGAMLLAVAWASVPAMPAAAEEFLPADQLRAAGYYRYWDTQLPVRADDSTSAIYVIDDTIYVTSAGGDVFAVHRGAGLMRWARTISRRNHQIFRPSHFDDGSGTGPVIFALTGGLIVIDRYTGDVVKKSTGKFAPGSGAVGAVFPVEEKKTQGLQYRLFAGSSDGHLYAMEWENPFQPQVIRLWRAMMGGPVRTAPVFVDEDHLYAAAVGGIVYCCRARTKAEQWSFDTGGPILGEMVVQDDGLYVSNVDRSVYRLDPMNGVMRWRRRLPELLEVGPVVMAGVVYQYCPRSGLHAIDANYGDELWTCPEGMDAISHYRDRIWVSTGTDRLLHVNAKNGDTVGEVRMPIGTIAALNPDDAGVYLVSPDGYLCCARPLSEKPLSPSDLDAAHATLNQRPRQAPKQ